VVRVFVGRLEIITPAMVSEVDRAIRARDMKLLKQYGRLLEPIAQRLLGGRPEGLRYKADPAAVQASLREVARDSSSRQAACRVTRSTAVATDGSSNRP
jgi:hypothetical protein